MARSEFLDFVDDDRKSRNTQMTFGRKLNNYRLAIVLHISTARMAFGESLLFGESLPFLLLIVKFILSPLVKGDYC